MKIQFESTSEHQIEPIERVCRVASAAILKLNIHEVFDSRKGETLFSRPRVDTVGIDASQALRAINEIRNGDDSLPSEPLLNLEAIPRAKTYGNELDLSIEMETGTGKTYTYLRTIFALSERNDLRSFIIVVPSVAIREGVLKTIEQTREHFASLYSGRRLDAFVYSGNRPGAVRNIGSGIGIDVMIITLDSFNKDSNVLRREGEDAYGLPLIKYIAAASPVVILDEPQNMSSERSQEALDLLNPLMTLRYSATHRDAVNLIYRLSPAAAREAGLVKNVEVVSMEEAGVRDRPYVRVKKITAGKTSYSASLEIERIENGVIKRKSISVGLTNKDDRKRNLFYLSGERAVYSDGWTITGIDGSAITFENRRRIATGEEIGNDRETIFRAQIRLTIENQIEKMRIAKPFGVKPLSLFFIDRVASWVDDDGIVRRLFTEELEIARARSDFPEEWRNLSAADLTEGYFASKPKKDGSAEILDTSGRQGDAVAEKRAYDLIMKGKEDLITFPSESDDTETRRRRQVAFIVSHSALREGWDNPNIFTICTLADATSTIRKRQEIGRGVRLPVDQSGNRIMDEDLNVLSVVANQSYEAFVLDYQKECEAAGADNNPPRKRRKKTPVKVQEHIALDEDFQALWRRASRKTMWHVDLDTDAIVRKVHNRMNEIIDLVHAPAIRIARARIGSDKDGQDRIIKTHDYADTISSPMIQSIPDVIELVSNALCREKNRLALTSQTIARICAHSVAIEGILRNPVQWASRAAQVIREVVEEEAVDGVKYEETGEEWEISRLTEHDREVVADTVDAGPRGLYDRVAVDSDPEKDIVASLRDRSIPQGTVRAFLKLPPWFKIMTPVGTYNPDFAIVKRDDATDRDTIYLVREIKGATPDGKEPVYNTDERRKIQCARAHYAVAAGGEIDYAVIANSSNI
jgi:type III restriction enzyme